MSVSDNKPKLDFIMGGEPSSGMDCLQLRQPPGPFHYLINEQAKSLVALQELQNEVGALLEFRDVVIETFPNLRTKLASSTPSTMTSHSSNIPVSVKRDWEPGVRVRRKLTNKEEARSGSAKKTGESAVQDSGFSTETSSKETHSASSSAPPASAPPGVVDTDEAEDELLNLLEIIYRKGTRLKDEVEALQGTLFEQGGNHHEESNFHRVLFHASADDVRQLRQERDMLLERLAEMEAEVLAGRVHTSRLQEDLENLLATKQDLEDQLRAVVSQRGEVNSKIHDLHLQFVTKSAASVGESGGKIKSVAGVNNVETSSQRTTIRKEISLDAVLGSKINKTKVPDTKKMAAVLQEKDPVVLQRHLLNSIVYNQVLQEKLETVSKLEVGLADKLDKAREENEDLQFQLEDKNIELEGTRARVRMLELLQKPMVSASSPDIIPAVETTENGLTRSEITTASMKAMSPIPLNLPLDHSSSTESAHDQAEAARKGDNTRRKPSKIPLVKNPVQKPPGGKHSPAPGARSRSGDSPGRPHSAQSWRNNRSEGNSLKGGNTSLPKSRNGSLVSARDSLTGKLRSSDSMSKLSPGNSFGRNTLRKSNSSVARRSVGGGGTIRDSPEAKVDLNCTKRKFHSPWILSSFNSNTDAQHYPDSLDITNSGSPATTETSNNHFQTANNFLWTTGGPKNQYYDSIDSNLTSSMYQQNGEELAECDSLERHFSDTSHK